VITSPGLLCVSLSLSLTSLSACPHQALPKLRELQLIDVCVSKLRLVRETTPRLEFLTLQNVPQHCDMELELPELQTVDVRFWSGRPQAMETMLAAATKVGGVAPPWPPYLALSVTDPSLRPSPHPFVTQLVSFKSYKLWSNQSLTFASPALTSVDIHRSDGLSKLTVWAPNLRMLGLQVRYPCAPLLDPY